MLVGDHVSAKRIRFTPLELEAIASALALWEATAGTTDDEQEGDVSLEDAKRLTQANDSAAEKVAILRGRGGP